jgi:glyoxylase-like metal-dependent hydrolase (beta-lactamase superfamily II)
MLSAGAVGSGEAPLHTLDRPQLSVECHLLDTGYCLAWEHHLIRGGRRCLIHCHALVALIRHPRHGWLLWDTGYSARMLDATRRLPFRLYRALTPLRLDPALAVVAQLAGWGLAPRDIGHVVISHFHADHVAGLRDFPDARLVAGRAAYADVAPRRGLGALRRGIIPALLPDDFAARAELVECQGPPLGALGPTHDLFGDGTLLLVSLPGHAHGQFGMLAHTERGPVLLAADGSWLSRSIRERQPPHWITNLLVDDPAAVRATIERLYDFAQAHPDVAVLPTHCPEVFEQYVASCR